MGKNSDIMLRKQRNRDKYTFANINLMGPCNANCYFCLGKDIENIVSTENQINTHFSRWKNFHKFIQKCKENDINKLYITGQNTDALMYKYLDELIKYLEENGFLVGIRTNGYLAETKLNILNTCNDEIGYSLHSLKENTNYQIMGRKDIPNWDYIIPNTKPKVRVSIVINRYNAQEFLDIINYLSKFDNLKYIQARKISTDTRYIELKEDMEIYEKLFKTIEEKFNKVKEFATANIYDIYGKEVCFWRTVQTTVNSMNYFTDGTISEDYFVVEGYLKNKSKE